MGDAMIQVECGKCGGSGSYYFGDRSRGACYPCNGSGKVKITAEAHDKAIAYRAKLADRMAKVRAEEARIALLFEVAEGMIEHSGIEGARAFYAAHPGDVSALGALVDAMRNARMYDASNKVVAKIRALAPSGVAL